MSTNVIGPSVMPGPLRCTRCHPAPHVRQCFQVDATTWLDEYLYALLAEEWSAENGPAFLAQ
jgi:hypothetical protein